MADEPAAPMKPQDTVIFLLGELKGQVGSLTESVNTSSAAQGAINKANEAEHAEFRKAINGHDIAIAIINGDKAVAKEFRQNRFTKWTLILGMPTTVATIIGLLAYINWHH